MDLSKWNFDPELEPLAIQFLQTAMIKGFDIRITQGRRTQEAQDILYRQGRTTAGKIVTWTKDSKHVLGKAFDICFNGKTPYPNTDSQWKALADIGREIGLTPGYYFKKNQDKPHFQLD